MTIPVDGKIVVKSMIEDDILIMDFADGTRMEVYHIGHEGGERLEYEIYTPVKIPEAVLKVLEKWGINRTYHVITLRGVEPEYCCVRGGALKTGTPEWKIIAICPVTGGKYVIWPEGEIGSPQAINTKGDAR